MQRNYKLFLSVLEIVGMPKATVAFTVLIFTLATVFEVAGISSIIPVVTYFTKPDDLAGKFMGSELWQSLNSLMVFFGFELTIELLLIIMVALFMSGITFNFLANWWVSRLRYKYIAECRVEMIDSILRAEVGYVSSRQVGELINDIQTEVERSLNFITQSIKAVALQ